MNRNSLNRCSGALFSLLLAGCVQAPPPASLTESWVPPKDSRKPDAVWQDLRAQSPDLSKPLSLPAIADIALQNNPATRKAWNEARAASAQVRYAEGYFMPSITAGVGLNRVTTAAHPESFDQNSMSYGPGLQLSYLICNFGGGRDAAVQQALQTVYAANFSFNQAIQDTLLNAELAYYSVISAQAGLEAAATNALNAKAILDAATARRDAGLGVDLDVLQAQTAHDQARYALASAQGLLQIAQGLLAQAMGLPSDTLVALIQPVAPLPASLSGQDMRRLTDEALARRPDLSSARAALSAREAAIRVARASRWPSLYATASATRNYYELYGESNRDSQSHDWTYMGGLSLKWNLFDGMQTLSSVRTAEAQAEALRAQLKQAELGASAEIWTRFQNYETALRKHEFSTSAMTSASSAREMALESYQSGVKTILDLLNADNQLAQSRNQQIAARQEVFTALARLAHATGIIEKGGGNFKDIKDTMDSRENR
jgi:TolC family type I secretion outer membrane protein